MQRRTRAKVRKFSDDSASDNDKEEDYEIGVRGNARIGVRGDAKVTAPSAKRFEEEDDY